MKTKHLFLVIIFLFSISLQAQKATKTSSKKPVSIYTFSNFSNDKNSFSAINKKLNLNDFNFVFIDIVDLDLNQFSIDANNLYKTPSDFINDDFERYQNSNLLKGFLLKNDPTRWNFHCPNPLSVQPTE